ncbi:MAG: YicC family protein [Clostridiales Family XIII bacterium]|jgi:uncharacterized protein (TIGR00255 family)|nr:YicC family protein [Clostridiales Family XIII bacterium]
MIKSMTGFGRGEAQDGLRAVTVEIRAVNHRYCEVSAKLPPKYAFAEDAVKAAVRACAQRGKVDVLVNVFSAAEEDVSVQVNAGAAKQYYQSLRELARQFDLAEDVPLALLAQMPDVIRQGKPGFDEDALASLILAAAEGALQEFCAMREAEGASLAADLEGRLAELEGLCAEIAERAPEAQEHHLAKMRERIAQMAEKVVDQNLLDQRIALEVAVFADKAGIDEELVRLTSHIAQFRGILASDGREPVGKRLDFLVQEMNREANTIGSKANDLLITEKMIALKTGVENIREQVQNIC